MLLAEMAAAVLLAACTAVRNGGQVLARGCASDCSHIPAGLRGRGSMGTLQKDAVRSAWALCTVLGVSQGRAGTNRS